MILYNIIRPNRDTRDAKDIRNAKDIKERLFNKKTLIDSYSKLKVKTIKN